MWTRKQLKERGKASFKANYWKCLLVALLLGIITSSYSGNFSFPSFGGSGFNVDSPEFNINNNYDHDYDYDDDDDDDDWDDDDDDDRDEVELDDDETEGVVVSEDGIIVNDGDDHVVFGEDGITVSDGDEHVVIGEDGITVNDDDDNVVIGEDGVTVNGESQPSVTVNTGDKELDEAIEKAIEDGDFNIPPEVIAGGIAFIVMMVIVTIIISLVIFVISVLVDAFLLNPIELGCNKFFYKNLEEPAHVSNVLFSFDHHYLNIVKIMFLRDLFIALWSLLFIIPGIIKSYEYRMIPYILADNPEMSKDEAFALSKQMMDGQKWNTFVLDLSFIGWDLLSILTCGLLSIFFVDPYRAATNAALYEALKINGSEPGSPVVEPVTPVAPVVEPAEEPVVEPVVEPEVVVE